LSKSPRVLKKEGTLKEKETVHPATGSNRGRGTRKEKDKISWLMDKHDWRNQKNQGGNQPKTLNGQTDIEKKRSID